MKVGPLVGHTFFTAGVKMNSISDHLSSCIELPESKDGNASGVAIITKEVATITKEVATITKEVATGSVSKYQIPVSKYQ